MIKISYCNNHWQFMIVLQFDIVTTNTCNNLKGILSDYHTLKPFILYCI